MKQVVREQCWLNEIISSVTWEPDVVKPDNSGSLEAPMAAGDDATTEAELQAVLEGGH